MNTPQKIHFGIISVLPDIFQSWLTTGIIGKAFAKKLLLWDCINPRDFGKGVYRAVDDSPYGGGPGMVMQVPPLLNALEKMQGIMPNAQVHVLAPEGRKFDNRIISHWLDNSKHILICGRYEGIDARFIQKIQPEVWSIGDFVLCGGELAAMIIMETLARYIPGVLGNQQSSCKDSFYNCASNTQLGLLDTNHYTRPTSVYNMNIPQVLQNGNHAQIDNWRQCNSLIKSWEYRPDLLRGKIPHPQQKSIAEYYEKRNIKYFIEKKNLVNSE